MSIIDVRGVSKEFRLGQLHGIKQSMRNGIARLRRQPLEQRQLVKALQEIDFQVAPGEVLGIIGHNGAGKSTLLKVIAGITSPTRGHVSVRGRVAPLIELGAGLVPELTGRENIFINASILGMRRAEIKSKFDDIVAFAELEEFIDTPIKRYSSGMAVRLGFAIATSVDADILIVDEVLAVGDLAFQRKCFDRMEEIMKRRGNTVLLVSHNIRQVERMCSRVILLDHGRIVSDGGAADACDRFFKQSNAKIHEYAHRSTRGVIRTSGEAEVTDVETLNAAGRPTDEITSGQPLRVRVIFELQRPLAQPEIIVGTHTTDFVYLTGSSTAIFSDRPSLDAGRHQVELTLSSFPLTAGVYCIRFVILDRTRRVVFAGDNLRSFIVSPRASEAREEGLRMLNVPAAWVMDGHELSEPALVERSG